MTDRHSGYIVVLEKDIRDDDAQAVISALRQIRGVASVLPLIGDPGIAIATARAKMEISGKILDVINNF